MKTLQFSLIATLMVSLAACGGGDSPAPEPTPAPAPVAPAAAYTVEGVSNQSGESALINPQSGNVFANFRLSLNAKMASVQIGSIVSLLLNRSTQSWIFVNNQNKTVTESDTSADGFGLFLKSFAFPLDAMQASGAQKTPTTKTIAGLNCDVWAVPTTTSCVTPDNILLESINTADNTTNYRVIWAKMGEPDPEAFAIPDTYADAFGPGNGKFQVKSVSTGMRLAFTGKTNDPPPGLRAGLVANDPAPTADSTQAFSFIRFDGATRDAARYLICTAKSTPALAFCLVPNAAGTGPVPVNIGTYQLDQPPTAALWRLKLADSDGSPGLTKSYLIVNAQTATLAMRALNQGGNPIVAMGTLGSYSDPSFHWNFTALNLP